MTDFHIWCFFLFLFSFITGVSSSGLPPGFTKLNVSVTESLPENTAVHGTVYTLIATDAEADNLTFGKVSQIPNVPDFQLNTKTGELYNPADIDADNNITMFLFIFDVSDGTSTVQSAQLMVLITDVNDNPPKFNASSYSGNISPNCSNSRSLQVTAEDADITSVLSYSIIAGNSPETFQIDPHGNITISNASNLMANYTLTVQASDGTFTDTTTVSIFVNSICTNNISTTDSITTSPSTGTITSTTTTTTSSRHSGTTNATTMSTTNIHVTISTRSTNFSTNNTANRLSINDNKEISIPSVCCIYVAINIIVTGLVYFVENCRIHVMVILGYTGRDHYKICKKDITWKRGRIVIGILIIIIAGTIVYLSLHFKYRHKIIKNVRICKHRTKKKCWRLTWDVSSKEHVTCYLINLYPKKAHEEALKTTDLSFDLSDPSENSMVGITVKLRNESLGPEAILPMKRFVNGDSTNVCVCCMKRNKVSPGNVPIKPDTKGFMQNPVTLSREKNNKTSHTLSGSDELLGSNVLSNKHLPPQQAPKNTTWNEKGVELLNATDRTSQSPRLRVISSFVLK